MDSVLHSLDSNGIAEGFLMDSNGEDLNGTADFRINVMTQLTALNKGQDDICKKLDKANGNIGELFDKAEKGVVALKDHIIGCPKTELLEMLRLRLEVLDKELALGNHPGSKDVVRRVETLERLVEAQQEAKKLGRFFIGLIVPILSAAGGALIMYVVEVSRHFPALPK